MTVHSAMLRRASARGTHTEPSIIQAAHQQASNPLIPWIRTLVEGAAILLKPLLFVRPKFVISDPTQTSSVPFRPDSVLKTSGPGGDREYPTKCKVEASPRVPRLAYAFPFPYYFEKKGISFFIK